MVRGFDDSYRGDTVGVNLVGRAWGMCPPNNFIDGSAPNNCQLVTFLLTLAAGASSH